MPIWEVSFPATHLLGGLASNRRRSITWRTLEPTVKQSSPATFGPALNEERAKEWADNTRTLSTELWICTLIARASSFQLELFRNLDDDDKPRHQKGRRRAAEKTRRTRNKKKDEASQLRRQTNFTGTWPGESQWLFGRRWCPMKTASSQLTGKRS